MQGIAIGSLIKFHAEILDSLKLMNIFFIIGKLYGNQGERGCRFAQINIAISQNTI